MVLLHCKVVVVGDAMVGKSAMIQMFSTNGATFARNYLMTLGADYCVKEVPVDDTNTVVEMNIFDLSGQELYSRMLEGYLENTSCFIVVYDVTNKASFDNCTKWMELCRKQRKKMMGVLVANKADLRDRIAVPSVLGENFAKTNGLEFVMISSTQRSDVELPFQAIAKNFHRIYEEKVKALGDSK
eukprot:RCo048582